MVRNGASAAGDSERMCTYHCVCVYVAVRAQLNAIPSGVPSLSDINQILILIPGQVAASIWVMAVGLAPGITSASGPLRPAPLHLQATHVWS